MKGGRKHKRGRRLEAPWPPRPAYPRNHGRVVKSQSTTHHADNAVSNTEDERVHRGHVETGQPEELRHPRLAADTEVLTPSHFYGSKDDTHKQENSTAQKSCLEHPPNAQPPRAEVKFASSHHIGIEHAPVTCPQKANTPPHPASTNIDSPHYQQDVQVERAERAPSDTVLHQSTPPQDNRITKTSKHPSRPLRSLIESLPSFSFEDEGLIASMINGLGAKTDKARKAVEDNKALHEIIHQKDELIKWHESKNAQLKGKVKEMQNRGKGLEKFSTGLGLDLGRLQQEARDYGLKCGTIVDKKVAELEEIKSGLIQDFNATLDKIDKSRRQTKSVLDDCYAQLIISESRNVHLAERLRFQDRLYVEEKERCLSLEQQVLPCLKALDGLVVQNGHTLRSDLTTMRESLEDKAAEQERIAHLKQCAEALDTLRTTPFLTLNNVKQAEGILHER